MRFYLFLIAIFFLTYKNILGNPAPENDIHFHIDLQNIDEDRTITEGEKENDEERGEDYSSDSKKGSEDYIYNPHAEGSLKQQVHIKWYAGGRSNGCSGTMLTKYIAVTAGHCLHKATSVYVFPPDKKCGEDGGIRACKWSHWVTGEQNLGKKNGYDIGLLRLSKPMKGMRNIGFGSRTPSVGQRIEMAGTGLNNKDLCKSWRSFQKVQNKLSLPQWFYTESSVGKEVSGSCVGDSGGPAWSKDLVGITVSAPDGNDDGCTDSHTTFANLNYYKNWIKKKMHKVLNSC